MTSILFLLMTIFSGLIGGCSLLKAQANLSPIAYCKNITVFANASCIANPSAIDFDSASYDPEGGPLTFLRIPLGAFSYGTFTVDIIVIDSVGASDTAYGNTITVLDTFPPIALCRRDTIQLDSFAPVFITADSIDNGSYDACGPVFLSISPDSFGIGDVGKHQITLFVTDGSGNTASCKDTLVAARCKEKYPGGNMNCRFLIQDVTDLHNHNDVIVLETNQYPDYPRCDIWWSQDASVQKLCHNGGGNGCDMVYDEDECPIMVYDPIIRISGCYKPPSLIGLGCGDSCSVSCYGGNDVNIFVLVGGGVPPYTYLWSNGAPSNDTVFNVTAGSYFVTVTDAIGSSVLGGPFVITEPSPILIMPDSIIPDCQGDSLGGIYITVAGGCGPYTYAWSNGDSIEDIDSLSSGFYRVTVTDQNGCEKIDSFEVTNDFAAFSDSTLGLMAYFTNESHFCNNYSWNFGDGGTSTQENPVHNYASSGTYNVCLVLNCPPCTDTICDSITVTAVGIRDPNVSIPGLSIHPNPTTDQFWLNAQIPLEGRIQMQIHDLSGRRHLSQSFSGLSGKIPIDIHSLPAGLYFVEITTASGARKTFKLVVR